MLVALGTIATAAAGQTTWNWDGSGQTVVTALWPERNSGYMVIVNNDASDITLDINCDSRTLYLRRAGFGRGMFAIPSGGEFPVRVRDGTYKLYWGAGTSVEVRVRGGKTTTLAFDVFGPRNDGLRAIVHDGEKLREFTLFNSDADFRVITAQAPTVVVTSTPVLVAEPVYMPPPPPVKISTVGGALNLAAAIVGLFDRNKVQHDSRWGYNYQVTNNRWRRVSYQPVVVHPQPVVVVPPPRPPVIVQPPPVVVLPPPRPPVIVQPHPVVIQQRPPVIVAPAPPVMVVQQPRPPVIVQPQPVIVQPRPVVVVPQQPVVVRPPVVVAPEPPRRGGRR